MYKYEVAIQTDRDFEAEYYEYPSDIILYKGEPNGDYLELKDNLDDMYQYFMELFNGKYFEICNYTLIEIEMKHGINQTQLFDIPI